ncbi:MAG: hypothetical protein ABJN72_02150 [Sulfitobacter sp.]
MKKLSIGRRCFFFTHIDKKVNHERRSFGGWVRLSQSKEKRPGAAGATLPVVGADIAMKNSKKPNKPAKTDTYRRPAKSRATRIPTPKSRLSGRERVVGLTSVAREPREFRCESLLEGSVLHLLLARDDVLDIWEQPPRFRYIGPDGRPRWSYPDFLIWLTSGLKVYAQIKPAEIVERSNFREELECMRRDMPLEYADEIVLITDRSFAAYEARNARRLNQFLSIEEADADADIAGRLRALVGTTSIADLIDGAPDRGAAFRATFRAIYSGRAKPVAEGDITPQSVIVKGEIA